MAWIESHQSLAKHRKTLMTASILGVDRFKIIGHLHCLWWWAIDNVPSGGPSDGQIADYEVPVAAEWDGDPQAFTEALIQAGFLDKAEDGTLYLHDWYDYAGKLAEKRRKDAERKRAEREAKKDETETSSGGSDGSSSGLSNGRPADSLRDGAGNHNHNLNQKNNNPPNPPYGEIVDYLNEQAGTNFKSSTAATQRLIRARWNEGFRTDDFKMVIDKKVASWRGTEMHPYLRPQTLFGTKFEAYLNERPVLGSVRIRGDPETLAYAPGQDPNKEVVD